MQAGSSSEALRHRVQVTETIEGYYKRLEPSACHVLSRSLRDWVPPPGMLALEGDDAEDRTMDAP